MEVKPGKYTYDYPRASITSDCVIFGYDGGKLKILLIQRGIDPFKGMWAFPGGFLRMDETVEECARRELLEETGLATAYMEQFHTFSTVNRDPRGRVVTIAFFALVKISEVKGGDDAAKAAWFDLDALPELAFDHAQILEVAKQKLKERMHFEPVGFELIDEPFKMPDLQNLYEEILGVQFDRGNFSKKMLAMDILEETGDRAPDASRRIPKMYRFNKEKYQMMKEKGKGFSVEF
ncbi:MAG: NUDIX hydrolase [Bacteroidales bacterium]|nr:NUDIX hydrolase [Bacteroidales bacterium]